MACTLALPIPVVLSRSTVAMDSETIAATVL